MTTTYKETRYNFNAVKTASDGKTAVLDEKTGEAVIESQDCVVERKYTETIAAYKTAGLPDPEITKAQTFQYTEVESPDELMPLMLQYNPDEESAKKAAVAIINRGLVLAEQKAVREFMGDSDQGTIEGVYDLMADASKPGEGRRKADPASKAIKAISELLGKEITAADLASLLNSYQSQSV